MNGKLKEDIYIKLPPSFEDENKNFVCRLKKSIYGLKQAAKAWNDEIRSLVFKEGERRVSFSVDLRRRHRYRYKIKCCDERYKQMLASKFKVQDLGEVKQYLSIEA